MYRVHIVKSVALERREAVAGRYPLRVERVECRDGSIEFYVYEPDWRLKNTARMAGYVVLTLARIAAGDYVNDYELAQARESLLALVRPSSYHEKDKAVAKIWSRYTAYANALIAKGKDPPSLREWLSRRENLPFLVAWLRKWVPLRCWSEKWVEVVLR